VRVRLIESDAHLAEKFAALIRGAGHEVESSGAGADGAPDVLVVSLPAPREEAPDQAARAPIVILVGRSATELERWISGRPRWVLVPKPVPDKTLLAAIAEAAAKRSDSDSQGS
jgi:hypothetical protein